MTTCAPSSTRPLRVLYCGETGGVFREIRNWARGNGWSVQPLRSIKTLTEPAFLAEMRDTVVVIDVDSQGGMVRVRTDLRSLHADLPMVLLISDERESGLSALGMTTCRSTNPTQLNDAVAQTLSHRPEPSRRGRTTQGSPDLVTRLDGPDLLASFVLAIAGAILCSVTALMIWDSWILAIQAYCGGGVLSLVSAPILSGVPPLFRRAMTHFLG